MGKPSPVPFIRSLKTHKIECVLYSYMLSIVKVQPHAWKWYLTISEWWFCPGRAGIVEISERSIRRFSYPINCSSLNSKTIWSKWQNVKICETQVVETRAWIVLFPLTFSLLTISIVKTFRKQNWQFNIVPSENPIPPLMCTSLCPYVFQHMHLVETRSQKCSPQRLLEQLISWVLEVV